MIAPLRPTIQELKTRVRLSDYVARRVKLRRVGPEWFGFCPFHKEKTESFTVRDDKFFYKCFGCQAHGDVVDWLTRVEGLTLSEAIERLREDSGERKPIARDREVEEVEGTRRHAAALSILKSTVPIAGTLAEVYLREARGIRAALPPSLRFHPNLPAEPGGPTYPAMVAAVSDVRGAVVAVQRTFLRNDGCGKAPIERPKRALGPIRFGSVHLDRPPDVRSSLGICEGIETGLSALEIFFLPIWCALGSNLAGILLPAKIEHVIILGDRGDAGEAAAEKARAAFRAQGRRVAVRFPDIGNDFNDELLMVRRR